MAIHSNWISSFILAFSIGFSFVPAQAAGTTTPKKDVTTPAELKCKKKEIVKTKWKDGKKIKYCAAAVVGSLDDEDLFLQGRGLAKAGYYDWALDVLALVEIQNDPKVLNYIGYSHRKAGRLDTAISFYRKALTINPNYVLAREYLGEGYAAAGRIDLAQVELSEIGKRCGVQCTEYTELSKAISIANN